jgi:hypothetical protein
MEFTKKSLVILGLFTCVSLHGQRSERVNEKMKNFRQKKEWPAFEFQYSIISLVMLGQLQESSLSKNKSYSSFMNSIQIQKFITGSETKLSGLEFNYGVTSFADPLEERIYSMDDGSLAKVNVQADTKLNYLYYTYTQYFLSDYKIQPFITGKIGFGELKSVIKIYDADDTDNCVPLDKNVLSKSFTPLVAVGTGLAFDLSLIYHDLPSNFLLLNFSANINQGLKIKYSTLNEINSSLNNISGIVNGKFINKQTGEIHQHAVAYSNSAFFQMAEIKMALTLRLQPN